MPSRATSPRGPGTARFEDDEYEVEPPFDEEPPPAPGPPTLIHSRNPWRAVLGAAAVAGAGHMLLNVMPASQFTWNFTQTSVAVLALSALILLIGHHHRKEGHLLTHTQEEVVIIFCFGLFWIAFIAAKRAFEGPVVIPSAVQAPAAAAGIGAAGGMRQAAVPRHHSGYSTLRRPYGCPRNDPSCVVREERAYAYAGW